MSFHSIDSFIRFYPLDTSPTFLNILTKVLEKIYLGKKKTQRKFLFNTLTRYGDIWIQVFLAFLMVHAYIFCIIGQRYFYNP